MQGDLEAFYLRHFKAIYRVCYAFMKNAQDAEDCTEDAFVKAMTSDVTFENERHERSWLTTTAMNLCKDRLKHWWRQKVTDLDEETEQTAAEPDEKREVVDAVMALPVKYKEVVWLHYYEGYTAREIADITISSEDLFALVTLRSLSQELMARIHRNYRFIVSFNFSLIVLGVLGILPPTTSALLHNMSTLAIGLRSMTNLLPESEQNSIH